jgi:hypothetical protein
MPKTLLIFKPKRAPISAGVILALFLSFLLTGCSQRSEKEWLNKFQPISGTAESLKMTTTAGSFSGYTNYWHSIYWFWHSYGNLYQISQPDIAKSILQNKVDLAEELGIPGLVLEEGFLYSLAHSQWKELEEPSLETLQKALKDSDVLVSVSTNGNVGQLLQPKLPGSLRWRSEINPYQAKAADFYDLWAFRLQHGHRKLFVILSNRPEGRQHLLQLINNSIQIIKQYDLHRGWFGTGTLLHSVTCQPGHPLEIIGQGMNQGNDWFTFSGYMDYLLQKQLSEWLSKINLDIVTDVGASRSSHSLGTVAYGCENWHGLKVQDMATEEEWIKFVKDRHGYIFRPVYAPECDHFSYDGYIAIEGNKKQIDNEDVPFILQTGYIGEEAPGAMVIFVPKGEKFTREALWEAIISRREVGILPEGKIMGPEKFRSSLELLLLDRVYLEEYFGDRVQIEAGIEGYRLNVKLINTGEETLTGNLNFVVPSELKIKGPVSNKLSLPPQSVQKLQVELEATPAAMGQVNPILIDFKWKDGRKRTLTILDLPPAISVHKLLYGQAPQVDYPVSIHNFSSNESVEVNLKVVEASSREKTIYETKQKAVIKPGEHKELNFKLPLSPGNYQVEVSALGVENFTQLGVESASGQARCREVDLNGDGLNEYELENDKVRVTLLPIGARIIEYFVKERNDNILFKLWPEKEWSTDKRPFRERGFYPYGGFEDFLGQASIETHKVYQARVTKSAGSYVQVKMEADYYGNRLEKIFTLYGDSPLVEVRFALDFHNPELNMIGPQPMLELGKRHWVEDVFVVPSISGLLYFRMRPEEYYGRVIFLKEGWNAARDTIEDVAFVGAFPVSEPEFLHMWMNHPSNQESHHYYAELQPWVPIFQKNVRYFSYYLWGAAGSWEKILEQLRQRNLITQRSGGWLD